jgi:ATP-dependent Clp protease ATP-binding subunit ClpC
MFESYTEKARRVIFFARYEASKVGSPYVETEHLLLGLLLKDKSLGVVLQQKVLAKRVSRDRATAESIRKQIERQITVRDKIASSVDLSLSNESKRVLAYAAEEAKRLLHKQIDTAHLFLGLLREEKCSAARMLRERGVDLLSVREELGRITYDSEVRERAQETSLLLQFITNLSDATGQFQPLVGRESELKEVIQVLCGSTRRNPVLVGDPGVGKRAVIDGLIQRIADGTTPTLTEKSVLVLDLSPFGFIKRNRACLKRFESALSVAAEEGAVFVVDELYNPPKGLIHILDILKRLLVSDKIQCISTTSPNGYRKALEHHGWLEECFQPIQVAPASEDDAIKVLFAAKSEYERFHGVSYADEALTYAVYYGSRCIKEPQLPGKAIDLMDEAGACVKLRHSKLLPDEVTEAQKRIKFIVHRMENAIANHEFEKARFYSDEERKERENLRALREKHGLTVSVSDAVTREDVEDAVARKTGMSVVAIRQTLATDPNGPKTSHP